MKRIVLFTFIVFLFSPLQFALAKEHYVPIRNVFESVGSNVIDANGQIVIMRGENKIVLPKNGNFALKNGRKIPLYQPLVFLQNEEKYAIHVLDVYKLAKHEKKEKHYRVQPGDSLWDIAERYQVTVDELIAWNGLQSQQINPYQHLHVTDPMYEVQPGDNLFEIAKNNETTVAAIKEANNLTVDFLTPGQKIYIPIQPAMKAPQLFADGVFPLVQGSYRIYGNDFETTRTDASGNAVAHEGIDIIAPGWVPVFAITSGIIENLGWSTEGGWRILLKAPNGVAFYYAQLNGYPDGLREGQTVSRGQLIGYIGSTGNDANDIENELESHLHLSMYDTNTTPWKPLNPYYFLKWWEMNPNY